MKLSILEGCIRSGRMKLSILEGCIRRGRIKLSILEGCIRRGNNGQVEEEKMNFKGYWKILKRTL